MNIPGIFIALDPRARLPATFLLLLLVSFALPAQSLVLTGRAAGSGGEALAGAAVTVLPADAGDAPPPAPLARTLTARDGSFRLTLSEPALVRLRLEAPGFLPCEHPLIAAVDDAELPPAVLGRDDGLLLEVQDAAGQPVAGARVSSGPLGERGSVAGDGCRRSETVATTGPDGKVRVPHGAGERLAVQAFSRSLGQSPLETVGPSPGPGARTLRLQPHAGGAAAAIPPAPPALLRGRVLGPDGGPLAGALVWTSGRPLHATRAGAAGEFLLPVPAAGEVELHAATPGHVEERRRVRLPIGPRLEPVVLQRAVTVRGWVVDAAGVPIARADVAARQPVATQPTARASTAPDGRFQLRGLTAGRELVVEAHKEGYGAVAVTIRGDALTRLLRVVLRPGRPVVGVVQDPSQRPVAGATVTLVRQGERDGSRRETRTGDDGAFRFVDVAAGEVAAEVRAPGFAPLALPAIALPAGPSPWDLGTLVLASAARLEGRVVDTDENPIAGAAVRAMDAGDDGAPAAAATTADDGRFSLRDLPASGRFDLEVTAQDHARAWLRGVAVPAGEPLHIVLAPSSRLSGTVVTVDGGPVAGAVVTAVPRPLGADGPSAATIGVTGDDGAFSIDHLEPGTVLVGASAPGYLPARQRSVELVEGRELDGLELTLERGAALKGRVTAASGRALAGATVQAALEKGAGSGAVLQASSDESGAYHLAGVEPGTWLVSAHHRGALRRSERLEVQPGENLLDFTLPAGAEVTGSVIDGGGSAVAGARIALRPIGDRPAASPFPPVFPTALSAPDGSFRVAALEAGRYRLRAERAGFAPLLLDEELEIAEDAVLSGIVVRLERGAVVSGRLSGLPAEALGRVEVVALPEGSGGEPVMGKVDLRGGYRVEGLAAGQWLIGVAVPETGLQASGRVSLAAGEAAAVLDLDFAGAPADAADTAAD